jgi:hypothetical protein
MGQFLTEMKILKQRGAPLTCLQGIIRIGKLHSQIGSQLFVLIFRYEFAEPVTF